MRPDVCICHTPYQVLVELCRAFHSPCPPHLILSSVVPDAPALAGRLLGTGLFGSVRVFDEEACGSVSLKEGLPTLLFLHPLGRRNTVRHGLSLDKRRIGRVYIHNDWSVLGRYLQDEGIPYILCEDTFASTCAPEGHPLIDAQRALPHFALRRRLGYGHLYWGDWKGVAAVECEDPAKATVPFDRRRLVGRSQQKAFDSLTDAQKSLICRVFLTAPLPENTVGAVLLLTRDFVSDRLLDKATQARLFRAVAKEYCSVGPLFIKAHPRDATDYAAAFPDAVVLERTMPSEVLNFALPFRFRRAVTVESTVLKAFRAADEKVTLPLEDALALPGVRAES